MAAVTSSIRLAVCQTCVALARGGPAWTIEFRRAGREPDTNRQHLRGIRGPNVPVGIASAPAPALPTAGFEGFVRVSSYDREPSEGEAGGHRRRARRAKSRAPKAGPRRVLAKYGTKYRRLARVRAPETHPTCIIVAEQDAEAQIGAFCTLEG